MKYRVLVADPPWPEAKNMSAPTRPGKSREGARGHYDLFKSFAEVESFPIPPMADESLLFLWCPPRYHDQGRKVVEAWGFKNTPSPIVWVKVGKSGAPGLGSGVLLRMAHEEVLIGRRGKPTHNHNTRSAILAPRREHSQKPEELQDAIEAWTSGPYAELFARRQRAGWDCFGDQNTLMQEVR